MRATLRNGPTYATSVWSENGGGALSLDYLQIENYVAEVGCSVTIAWEPV